MSAAPNLCRVPQGEGCRRCASHTFVEDEDGRRCAACGTVPAGPERGTVRALAAAVEAAGWEITKAVSERGLGGAERVELVLIPTRKGDSLAE